MTWTYDATEGGTCSFSGTRQVRYGAHSQHAYKTLASSTACTNAVFGDRIRSVQKSCSDSSITP